MTVPRLGRGQAGGAALEALGHLASLPSGVQCPGNLLPMKVDEIKCGGGQSYV